MTEPEQMKSYEMVLGCILCLLTSVMPGISFFPSDKDAVHPFAADAVEEAPGGFATCAPPRASAGTGWGGRAMPLAVWGSPALGGWEFLVGREGISKTDRS